LPQAELARPYNVTRQTIRKWQDRDSPDDGSHCPTTLKTTLTPEQELIVIELRKTLLLPTDDLLAVTREFINPAVSRAGLGRWSGALVWGAACVAMVSPACLNWPPGKNRQARHQKVVQGLRTRLFTYGYQVLAAEA